MFTFGEFRAAAALRKFDGVDDLLRNRHRVSSKLRCVLLAALLNGFISLFKVDKKFQSSTRAYLNLESEGWSYFSLVGKYAEINPVTNMNPSHANRFNMFMQTVEKIRKGESRVQYAHGSGEISSSTRSRSAVELRGGGHPSTRSGVAGTKSNSAV